MPVRGSTLFLSMLEISVSDETKNGMARLLLLVHNAPGLVKLASLLAHNACDFTLASLFQAAARVAREHVFQQIERPRREPGLNVLGERTRVRRADTHVSSQTGRQQRRHAAPAEP